MKKMKKQALVICGLGFGDECKGSITDWLARKHSAHTVIRYNGGAQAAHNVVLSDGRHHTFSQFGSATFIPGVRTHLSKFVLVNPIGMLIEARKLADVGVIDALSRTTIDERALLVTPFHCSVNRLRELARGSGRFGSCGQGIGETVRDAKMRQGPVLTMSDLCNFRQLKKKLIEVQEMKAAHAKEIQMADDVATVYGQAIEREFKPLHSVKVVDEYVEWYRHFVKANTIVPPHHVAAVLARDGCTLFEGAQGALLDETHGFHPYVTWSNTTIANASSILKEASYDGQIERYGLLRAYATRHGSGPFVTEKQDLTQELPDTHNRMHEWQREFRVGWFDLVAAKHALSFAGPIDHLAISCIDRLEHLPVMKACIAYEYKNVNHGEEIFRDPRTQKTGIANALAECRPVYQCKSLFTNTKHFLDFIENELGISIAIESHGPTEKDKKFRLKMS